ncbi:MAG: hypothetical protein MZV64_64040 [Ignavibacteriales bacterium]|nr:hypothetical protein [Ignavibacteriales bacterium]
MPGASPASGRSMVSVSVTACTDLPTRAVPAGTACPLAASMSRAVSTISGSAVPGTA